MTTFASPTTHSQWLCGEAMLAIAGRRGYSDEKQENPMAG